MSVTHTAEYKHADAPHVTYSTAGWAPASSEPPTVTAAVP